MKYTVNINDIEQTLINLGGQADAGKIKDKITIDHCSGKIPENYKDKRSFRETIQRNIENYCPQSKDYDASKYEGKFIKVKRGLYRLAVNHRNQVPPLNLADQEANFQLMVEDSLTDSPSSRQKRLLKAIKIPMKVKAITEIYIRNADVVAEILHRARGTCERCEKSAPFARRKDGTPYLEVHHITRLAEGGEDTVDNAIALCPNCHRELHFGPKPPPIQS